MAACSNVDANANANVPGQQSATADSGLLAPPLSGWFRVRVRVRVWVRVRVRVTLTLTLTLILTPTLALALALTLTQDQLVEGKRAGGR